MYECHFFIRDTPWGTGVMPKVLYGGRQEGPPHSTCWFCPTCGEIWARMICPAAKDQAFTLEWRKCDRHPALGPRAFDLPGSLWKDWNADYVEHLPESILRREFDIHLKHFDEWRLTIESERILERE